MSIIRGSGLANCFQPSQSILCEHAVVDNEHGCNVLRVDALARDVRMVEIIGPKFVNLCARRVLDLQEDEQSFRLQTAGLRYADSSGALGASKV